MIHDPLMQVHLLEELTLQQRAWAGMHQCYSHRYVWEEIQEGLMPSDEKAGELLVKHLLAGGRGHYGPLEELGITVAFGYMPHSVMQQLRTHRIGLCLSGDTEVSFTHKSLSPGQTFYKKTLAELHELWTVGRKHQRSEADAAYMRKAIQKRRVLVLNTDTNRLESTQIVNIYSNGKKPLFCLKTRTGESIKASADHLFWTDKGWRPVRDLNVGDSLCKIGVAGNRAKPFEIPLSEDELAGEVWKEIKGYPFYEVSNLGRVRSWMPRGGRCRSTDRTKAPRLKSPSRSKTYLFVSLTELPGINEGVRANIHRLVLEAFGPDRRLNDESRHLDGNGYNNRLDNLCWGDSKANKDDNTRNNVNVCNRGVFTLIASIESCGEEETFDIEVAHPSHNFVGNGLVTHNSFDCQSMRYTSQGFLDAASQIGILDLGHPPDIEALERVFYLRQPGPYRSRYGANYIYTEAQREEDLELCWANLKRYQERIEGGCSEEHARGILPFDYRQHFVVSFNNIRSLWHMLDLRMKLDAQGEAQHAMELLWQATQDIAPQLQEWYQATRAGKAKLSP